MKIVSYGFTYFRGIKMKRITQHKTKKKMNESRKYKTHTNTLKLYVNMTQIVKKKVIVKKNQRQCTQKKIFLFVDYQNELTLIFKFINKCFESFD